MGFKDETLGVCLMGKLTQGVFAMTSPKTTDSLCRSLANTTMKDPTSTKPATDRCASDMMEGVYLADLCDALACNGYPITAIALSHKWAEFRLIVNVAKRKLSDDIQQKLTRR